MEWVDYLKVIGAFGTAFSVLWAIFVFRRSEDRQTFSGVRSQLGKIRSKVSQLDSLLSEAEFSRIANSVTVNIRALKSNDCSLEEFTNFIKSEDNDHRNFIARAIHQGRNDCGTIENIEDTIRDLRESTNVFKEPFPITHKAMNKLLFYVLRMGQTSVSPKLINMGIGNPEAINQVLVPELSKYFNNEEFYFAEMSLFISAVPSAALKSDRFGQQTFDESEKMINIIVETMSKMNDAELRKLSSFQKKHYKSLETIDEEHAVEDALGYLQKIRKIFEDSDWDKLVGSKTTIVNLMNN